MLSYAIHFSFKMGEVKEWGAEYSSVCEEFKECEVQIEIESDPEYEFLIFLEMKNFFQSNKNFAEGFSKSQLQGKKISLKTAKRECRGAVFNKDFDLNPEHFDPS